MRAGKCARREQPGVVGDALVLDLLARMPAPQLGRLMVRAFEMPRVGEQLVGEDGGEMLERHGRREADDRRLRLGDAQAILDLLLQLRQIVAGVGRAAVERVMLAAVDRFLGGECLDLLGELGRRALAEGANALDEERLAGGEGGRKRIVDCGRLDAPAMP